MRHFNNPDSSSKGKSKLVIKAIIVQLGLIILSGCSYTGEKESFDPNELENAWRDNNKRIVSSWIRSLEDEKLSDGDFFSRVAYLSTTTNFCFGTLEVDDSTWQKNDADIKRIVRRNIALAYKTYLNSCLFFSKQISWDDTLPLQDRFFKSYELLTREEVKLLGVEIQKICSGNEQRSPGESDSKP